MIFTYNYCFDHGLLSIDQERGSFHPVLIVFPLISYTIVPAFVQGNLLERAKKIKQTLLHNFIIEIPTTLNRIQMHAAKKFVAMVRTETDLLYRKARESTFRLHPQTETGPRIALTEVW